jgi:hypothetical protein
MSLKIVKSFPLDFTRDSPLEYIFVKAGDKNSRVLDITPLDSGLPYAIPDGVKAIFAAKKPDKTEILNNATVNKGTGHIEVILSEQTLAAEGIIVCEVALYTASDEFLSSQHFYMKASPFAIPDAESGNEYTSFVVALLAVDAKVREAEEAISKAEDATKAITDALEGGELGNTREVAEKVVAEHDVSELAHADIRELIETLAANVYDKVAVDRLVSLIPKLTIEPVEALPELADASLTAFYLVPSGESESDVYTEWFCVERDGVRAWERLGTQKMDLSGYATTEAMNTAITNAIADALVGYATEGHLHDGRYIKREELNGAVSSVLNLAQEAGDSETRAMSQKAVTALVRDSLGIQSEHETVDTVEEMTDTSVQYVLSGTGTVWAYREVEKPNFTNQIPASTDTDGSVFNETGYQENARFNSSCAIKTDLTAGCTTPVWVTGFIPLVTGDVIRLKNCWFDADGTAAVYGANYGGCYHAFYDSNKTQISKITWERGVEGNTVGIKDVVVDEAGNVVRFTVAAPAQGIAYMRFTLAGDAPNAILTVNEEIAYTFYGEWYNTGLAPNTSGGGNYVDLLVKVNENADEIEDVSDRVRTLETAGGTYTVPAYWDDPNDATRPSHLSGKIEAVKALQEAGGRDVVNFLWFSDFHYGGNKSYTRNVGTLCAAVMDACDIPLTLMCGDTMSQGSPASESVYDSLLETTRDLYAPIGADRLMLVKGNHDDVYGQAGDVSYVNKVAPEKVWNKLYRPQARDLRRVFGGDGTFFYLDNVPQKVRFICLNSSFYDGDAVTSGTEKAMSVGFGAEQLAWLQDVALAVEDDWSVAVCMHVPPIAGYAEEFDKTEYDGVRNIIKNTAADVIALFCGHMHRDNIYTDDLPCPICVVTCATNKPYDGTAAERVAGTTFETALDVVSINKATRTIHMTRIGHGADRSVTY